MKMKNFFLLIFLISFKFLYPQNNLIFSDNFDDNSNRWRTSGFPTVANIKNGYFFISNRLSEKPFYVTQSLFVNFQKDFTIEASIKNLSEKSDGFSIVWGMRDENNFNTFFITSEGFFGIIKKSHNRNKTFEYNRIKKNFSKNLSNNLKIRRSGRVLEFLFNDEILFSINPDELTKNEGSKIGFSVSSFTSISVDFLKIYQNSGKINLVKNMRFKSPKENMGNLINSKFIEKSPIISADGKTLYFIRENHPENVGRLKNQDVWFSELEKNDKWGKAENIGFPINNEDGNFVNSVMPDNNTLLLGNTYNNDGSLKGGGISISHRTINSWSIPKDIFIENYHSLGRYVSYSLSDNGMTLLMSVERNDSYGGRDLYVSFRTDKNYFSKPKNLGSIVNTVSNEHTPFLASDNKTLYFETQGKAGYGNSDIFISRRLDETWTNWSEPQNLGQLINTEGADGGFNVPSSGEYAYFVSQDESIGALDIFRIKLPEELKPEAVALISGKILDPKTNEAIGAEIVFRELETGKLEGIAHSNPKDGSYKITLPKGKKYFFMPVKKDYFALSQNIDLTNMEEYKELKTDLILYKIEENQIIELNNLFFESSKSKIQKASFTELKRLIELLNEYKNMKIEILGHTDNVGSKNYNLKLSKDRAKAVVSFLIKNGIDEKRLSYKSYGMEKPLANNETEMGRSKNRRVEFKIISYK